MLTVQTVLRKDMIVMMRLVQLVLITLIVTLRLRRGREGQWRHSRSMTGPLTTPLEHLNPVGKVGHVNKLRVWQTAGEGGRGLASEIVHHPLLGRMVDGAGVIVVIREAVIRCHHHGVILSGTHGTR